MIPLRNVSPKSWDWVLFFSIALYTIIPSIYQSYSVFLIGNTPPDEQNLEIVAQWQFVQVLFEVIQEAMVFPVFYFVGSQIKNSKTIILERIKISLTILALVLMPIFLCLFFGMDFFINTIGVDQQIVGKTQSYLGIKIWALLFSIFNLGLLIIIESLKIKKILLLLVFIKLLLFIFLDSLFFGGYSFSLGMGVIGLALSNFLVEFFVFIFLLVKLLQAFQISIIQFLKIPSFKNLHLFSRVSVGIAIESLIKNVAYFTLILKMLNNIGSKEIGGYYLAMHLFWSFFLVPTFIISDTLKVLIANTSKHITEVWKLLKFGLILILLLNACFLLFLPFLKSVLSFFSNAPDLIQLGEEAVKWLIVPYLLLSVNLVISALFYGLGETKYLALKTLWTNGLVYLTAYIFYLLGYWLPEYQDILLLFGVGILVGTFFTVYYARKVLISEPNKKLIGLEQKNKYWQE